MSIETWTAYSCFFSPSIKRPWLSETQGALSLLERVYIWKVSYYKENISEFDLDIWSILSLKRLNHLNPFPSLDRYAYSLYWSLHIYSSIYMENLSTNSELFLVTDHFSDFMTFMSDHFPYSHDLNVWLKVLLSGEIRCQSLLGIKRLRETDCGYPSFGKPQRSEYEQTLSLWFARTQTSTVSEHANGTGHIPIWSKTKYIDRDPHWYTHRVKEAIHIRLHPNNINRDGGIGNPEAWMRTIKQHNGRFMRTYEGTAYNNQNNNEDWNALITAYQRATNSDT